MTRAEASEHLAAVMDEWWPNLGYTPERIAERLAMLEKNSTFVDETEMWYPKFAMDVLHRAGLIDESDESADFAKAA
jgi:hypothetical protein